MKVLNFGSLNLDYVYSVSHMVLPGETLASGGMDTFCGGKGLNQSIALAKAGVPVYHAGMVGEEGEPLLNACKAAGVNTDYIKTISGKSGHTIIQIDESGQNAILLYGGANRSITREYVDQVLQDFEQGDILLLQNEINQLDYIIDIAFEKGMVIMLNPSPFDSNLDSCDFDKISVFLLNEIEGAQITGEEEPDRILAILKERYPGAKVVLTLGSQGSIYQDQQQQVRQGIYPVKAVDTTGAGDTFTGYFIASLIEGLTVKAGLEMAAKASALAVSRQGAAPSIPTRSEVISADEWVAGS